MGRDLRPWFNYPWAHSIQPSRGDDNAGGDKKVTELCGERCLREGNFTNGQFTAMSSFAVQLNVLIVEPGKY